MIRIFKKYQFPRHLEIVCMLLIGILLQIMDGSPFTMKERWRVVWDTDLPTNHFNPFVQKCIKTLLSVIVTVRCTTTYVYVVSATLVIFCILRRMAPKLIRLWLLIAWIKPISMIFLEGLIGVYVCSAFGKIRKACVEFFIVKALELIFSTYLWGSVLDIYKNIEKELEQRNAAKMEDSLLKKHDFRRLRARSLIDESTLNKTTYLNSFERRDVPLLILQMLKRDEEMSDDSLLAPGMMLASVSNLGSFDNIKTSQSLGELGFTDLTNTEVFGIEENENLPMKEKVLKFLKITGSEVLNIRLNKSSVEKDIYNVSDDIWKRVVASGMPVKQPRQPRTEIFIRKISPMDLSDEELPTTEKVMHMPFRSIFSVLFNDKKGKNDDEGEDEDRDITSQDDEDDDHIFMSNLKDGCPINRINMGTSFKKMRGREYANLYKQDYMTSIGPEVFDRASKLPKLTSLTKIRAIASRGMRSSPDLSRKKSRRIKHIEYFNEEKSEDYWLHGHHSGSMANIYHRDNRHTISFDVQKSENNFKRLKELADEEDKTELEDEEAPYTKPKEEEAAAPIKLENKAISEIKLGKEETAEEKSKEKRKLEEEISPGPTSGKEKSPEQKQEEEKVSELKLKDVPVKIKKSDLTSKKTRDTGSIDRTSATAPGSAYLSESDNSETTKPGPTYRRRKIIIKWVGQRKPKLLFRNRLSGNRSPSDDSDSVTDFPPKSAPESKKEPEEPLSSEKQSISKSDASARVKNKKFKNIDSQQIYYVSELFKKPFFDVLVTYYDLKKRAYLRSHVQPLRDKLNFPKLPEGKNSLKETERLLNSLAMESKQKRNWKSEVLKRSEPRGQVLPATSGSLINILKKRDAIRKLLLYEYHYLMQKYKNLHGTKTDDFGFTSPDENSAETDTSDSGDGSETESDTNTSLNATTDSADSGFLKGYASDQPEESTSEVLSPAVSDLQPSDHLYTEDDDIQTGTADTAKPETGLDTEGRAFRGLASEEGELLSNQESDEPISLYYSKAANLASPLLDMKGFIYPDHIHYSYKHVKKKGFDVDINGGFPLLMRESLTVGGTRVKMEHKWEAKKQDCEITRRPMDLSFAKTNAFTEWHSSDQNDLDSTTSETILAAECDDSAGEIKSDTDLAQSDEKKWEKGPVERCNNRKCQDSIENEVKKARHKWQEQNSDDLRYLYQAKDSALIVKLLKMHKKLNTEDRSGTEERQRSPVQISSTQLHSNKGRLSPTYNPAIVLQENKTNNEKKKSENQKERTKYMFARLEREALLQNKAVQKSLGHTQKS